MYCANVQATSSSVVSRLHRIRFGAPWDIELYFSESHVQKTKNN